MGARNKNMKNVRNELENGKFHSSLKVIARFFTHPSRLPINILLLLDEKQENVAKQEKSLCLCPLHRLGRGKERDVIEGRAR